MVCPGSFVTHNANSGLYLSKKKKKSKFWLKPSLFCYSVDDQMKHATIMTDHLILDTVTYVLIMEFYILLPNIAKLTLLWDFGRDIFDICTVTGGCCRVPGGCL